MKIGLIKDVNKKQLIQYFTYNYYV